MVEYVFFESNIPKFGRTDLRKGVSEANFDVEADFDVKQSLAPKSAENQEKPKILAKTFPKKKFGIEKSKVANRPKRIFPKFRADVRGVNERSKFEYVQIRSNTFEYVLPIVEGIRHRLARQLEQHLLEVHKKNAFEIKKSVLAYLTIKIQTSNVRAPLELGSDRHETSGKRVSDDLQLSIFRRRKICFEKISGFS